MGSGGEGGHQGKLRTLVLGDLGICVSTGRDQPSGSELEIVPEEFVCHSATAGPGFPSVRKGLKLCYAGPCAYKSCLCPVIKQLRCVSSDFDFHVCVYISN